MLNPSGEGGGRPDRADTQTRTRHPVPTEAVSAHNDGALRRDPRGPPLGDDSSTVPIGLYEQLFNY